MERSGVDVHPPTPTLFYPGLACSRFLVMTVTMTRVHVVRFVCERFVDAAAAALGDDDEHGERA